MHILERSRAHQTSYASPATDIDNSDLPAALKLIAPLTAAPDNLFTPLALPVHRPAYGH